MSMGDLLTVSDVATYLKLSRTTVWRWCHAGKLPAVKVGRGWRIHQSEVERIVGPEVQVNHREQLAIIRPGNSE